MQELAPLDRTLPQPSVDVVALRPQPAVDYRSLRADMPPVRRLPRRRWKTVLLVAPMLGIGVGWLVAVIQTPAYRARASLEVQDLNDNFLNIKDVLPVSNSAFSSASADVQTQIKIMQSEAMLERIKSRMVARARALSPSRSARRGWRAWLGGVLPDDHGGAERQVESMFRSLHIRAAGQSRVIEISADASDPNLAADFVNQLCREIIDQNTETRWKMSHSTGDWLGGLLEDMRAKLRTSEDALQQYAKTSGLLFTSEKKSVAEEKLRQLQEELSRTEANRIAKQSRYEVLRAGAGDTVPDTLNDALRRDYESKIADLRRQRADLGTTFTDGETRIRRLDAQIAALEDAYRKEQANFTARVRNEYEESSRREGMVAADYQRQLQRVEDLAARAVQYNILQREVDSNRQLYDSMLQRVKEATIASAIRSSNVRVIDVATPPERPFRPNVLLNCMFGIVACVLAAVVFSLSAEQSDPHLREPGDAQLEFALDELGVVPHDRTLRPALLPWPLRKKRAAVPASMLEFDLLGGNGSGSTGSRQKIDNALVRESYRAVLASLLLSGKNGRVPRVIAVTSPGPGDGKTAVVTKLAVTLAGVGRRVLLVDGDLRQQRLHSILGLNNDRGLASVLGGGSQNLHSSIQDVVQGSTIPGLSVLTAGPCDVRKPLLLDADSIMRLMNELRTRYDFILIDTPPVLQIADARVIGSVSDGVILVARSGRTRREALAAASQRLRSDNTVVLGMILNDWNPKSSSIGYYGYDYHHYIGLS